VPAADVVFRNGAVLTGDPAGPRAAAVAVRSGQVVALDDDAVALTGAGTTVVDLAGGALLPAFADGHAHPLLGGVELAEAPVRAASSVEEAVAAVKRYAADHPHRPWVTGAGYDPTLAPDGRFEAAWLDAVVPDRPVVLTSTDHHVVWCNSAALRVAGITAGTPDPPSGTVVRYPDGTPTGTLREWPAMELVSRHVPARTPQERAAGLAEAARRYAAAGVTWVLDAMTQPDDVSLYLAHAAERSPVRFSLALLAEPGTWPQRRVAFGRARDAAAGSPDVAVRTVKFFADGVVEAGTAALLEPYADDPASRGTAMWAPDELAAAVAAVDADGFEAHIHAIGDAAVRAALDAVEHAVTVNGPRPRRPVIAHAQLVDPADLPRFAALGVVANFSPLWAQLDSCQRDLTLPRLGPLRGGRQYPMATLASTGAVLSFGSDWPVTALEPLAGLAVAVTRQTPNGQPPAGWVPEQRLPVATALSAYTAGVAYQGFEEAERGTVAVGKRADLVHLGADPTRVPPRELPDIPVLGTWLAGRRTHRA
jgi:predicted amidohydrolase YtcJ